MDSVFAPWRIDWVERSDKQDDICTFCQLDESDDDESNRILRRSEYAFAVLNNAPYTPGHILVVPTHHGGDFTELDGEVILDVFNLVQESIAALGREFSPDGYNVGMNIGPAGGASIESHLHVHVVPRWERDTTFLPTTANTNIIAEALDESYSRLIDSFDRS